MIPPSFSDLGKAAKDIFDKNFKFGKVSVDIKTKSKEGVELNMKGDHLTKDEKLNGSLETVYKFNNGLKSTIKWETNKKLLSCLSIEDIIKQGTKFGGDFTFIPDTGEKTLKTTASFKADLFNGSLVGDFKSLQPVLTSSLVIGCTQNRPYVVGGEVQFDTSKMGVTRHKLATGYHSKDMSIIGSIQNFNTIESLIYQKLNNDIEVGVHVKWERDNRESDFTVGGKYNLDRDSFVKAKVNSKSKLGLAYGFKAKDNVSMTLSTELDCKSLENGPHKFGVELCYSP